MRIYLGAPMFEDADINYNLHLANKLRAETFDVYCPNENLSINDKTKTDITPEKIYSADIAEMLNCNVFLCRISDDAGVMWEAGYMDCLSKLLPEKYYGVIGLTTDIRWKTKPDAKLEKANNQAYYFNGFAIGGINLSLGVFYDVPSLITRLTEIRHERCVK